MANDRTRRFAGLGQAQQPEPSSGDLFAHYGVQTEPDATEGAVSAEPVAVLACPACGWFRATPLVEVCPICAAPPRTDEAADASSAASPETTDDDTTDGDSDGDSDGPGPSA